MLDDCKQYYLNIADRLPGWKGMTRSDLCYKYVECLDLNDNLADAYLAAIIVKFWNVAEHNYKAQMVKLATEEDCYNWNLDGIMYALNKRVWEDPKSTLFNSFNAPEKAINVRIASLKINFYNFAKRQNRRLNYTTESLDRLRDEYQDNFGLPFYDGDAELDDNALLDYTTYMIKNSFERKEYLTSFVLDAIINNDLFEDANDNPHNGRAFSMKKLKRHLWGINDSYCAFFAHMYGYDIAQVKKALGYIQNTSRDRMERSLTRLFKELARDKGLKEMVTVKC